MAPTISFNGYKTTNSGTFPSRYTTPFSGGSTIYTSPMGSGYNKRGNIIRLQLSNYSGYTINSLTVKLNIYYPDGTYSPTSNSFRLGLYSTDSALAAFPTSQPSTGKIATAYAGAGKTFNSNGTQLTFTFTDLNLTPQQYLYLKLWTPLNMTLYAGTGSTSNTASITYTSYERNVGVKVGTSNTGTITATLYPNTTSIATSSTTTEKTINSIDFSSSYHSVGITNTPAAGYDFSYYLVIPDGGSASTGTKFTNSSITIGVGEDYNPVANSTNKVTVVAYFTKKTYTITYYKENGTAWGSSYNQTKTHGVSLTLRTTGPSKSGSSTTSTYNFYQNYDSSDTAKTTESLSTTISYSLSKWNTNKSGTGTSYALGSSYTTNANLNLYPIYSQSYTYEYSTFPILKRDGYTFKGWSTSRTGTVAYEGGDSLSSSYQIYNWYAIWEKNSYNLTYNANGGSGAPAATTFIPNVEKTLSSTEPIRSGYTFKGWSLYNNNEQARYSPGGSYKFTSTSDITLYAVWWPRFDWNSTYTTEKANELIGYLNNHLNANLDILEFQKTKIDADWYNEIMNYVFNISTIIVTELDSKTLKTDLETMADAYNSY